MELSYTVLCQVIVMILLMSVGYFSFKVKFADDNGSKQMTNILLYIVSPAVIINSYHTEFKPQLAVNLLIALILAVISHLVAMAISYLFVKKNKSNNADIERFAIIYSNSGFMAFPLVQALFGTEGVFYASAYLTVFTILTWTHGYVIMSGKSDKTAIKKAFLSPIMFSVLIGLIIFFAKISLPSVISDSIKHIAALNTPLAMIVLGITLAQTNILSAFKSMRYYYISFLTLILVPLISMMIYLFLPIDDNIIIVNLISTACPCAVNTVLFSNKFNRNTNYASMVITNNTMLSVITIPLVILIFQALRSLI